HRRGLEARGLDAAAIEDGGYASLWLRGRSAIARHLLEAGFDRELLLAVPGFHLEEPGIGEAWLSFGGPPGLVVPVRDVTGRVVALKVRRDIPGEDEARYCYISSAAHGGPGPGAPVHVPAWLGGTDVVRITEGELKAHVATRLSGTLTISVPGVSAWRGALPVLQHLGPQRALLAFDVDAATNPHVARATKATERALADAGFDLAVETWNPARAKGIDDALAAGVPIKTRRGSPAGGALPALVIVGTPDAEDAGDAGAQPGE